MLQGSTSTPGTSSSYGTCAAPQRSHPLHPPAAAPLRDPQCRRTLTCTSGCSSYLRPKFCQLLEVLAL